jgi:hypothetical protein
MGQEVDDIADVPEMLAQYYDLPWQAVKVFEHLF